MWLVVKRNSFRNSGAICEWFVHSVKCEFKFFKLFFSAKSGTIFNYHILIWPNFIWFIKWFIIKSDLSDLSDLSSDLSDLIGISDLFLNLYTRILKFQIAKIGQIEIIEEKKIKKSKMEIRNSLVSSFLSIILVEKTTGTYQGIPGSVLTLTLLIFLFITTLSIYRYR